MSVISKSKQNHSFWPKISFGQKLDAHMNAYLQCTEICFTIISDYYFEKENVGDTSFKTIPMNFTIALYPLSSPLKEQGLFLHINVMQTFKTEI
jgi:hypothetical protein